MTALNTFGFELYARWARDNKGSYVLAPASIALALLQLWHGASGETAAQIARSLHLGIPDHARVVEAASELHRKVFDAGANAAGMTFASRLFADESLVLDPTFVATSRSAFLADVGRLRFAADPAACLVEVNRWAREATGGEIRELLPPGAVDGTTRLVLMNAVRLAAQWEYAFDVKDTEEQPFNAPSGSRDVPMMQQRAIVGFADHDAWSMIELPHAGSRTTFQVLLPKVVGSFEAVDAALRAGAGIGLPTSLVSVSLPRFEVVPPEARELGPYLADIGITRAFSRDAELPGLGRGADDSASVYLSGAYHHGVVRVDERGTQAAAASGVTGARAGVSPEFIADHPFVFIVRDRATGLVLFIGRYVESTSQ